MLITNKNFLGRKIDFIKTLRGAFGIGLKEAKEISDQFCGHEVLDVPELNGCTIFCYQDYYAVAGKEPAIKQVKEIVISAVEEEDYAFAKELIDVLTRGKL